MTHTDTEAKVSDSRSEARLPAPTPGACPRPTHPGPAHGVVARFRCALPSRLRELSLAVPVVEMLGSAEHVVGVSSPDTDLVAIRIFGDPDLVLRGHHCHPHGFP